tara:strand:+ start:27085 stop:27990 length:906 start_codon:yes stop_codon:yes gene_type:complete
MEEKNYIEKDFSDYINVILNFFKENLIPICSVTFLSAIFSIWIALNIVNEYRSVATLIPSSLNEQSSSLGGLSALGGLAGMDMNVEGAANNLIAKELFKSKVFINKFVNDNDLLTTIMAAKGWNQENNQIIIDEKIFNNGKWQRPQDGLIKPKPGPEEVYLKFTSKFSFSQERDKVITVSYTSFSPFLSQKILALLIEAVNNEVRQRDISEAESSKDFLMRQLENTKEVNISVLIANLIEDEIKNIKLAQVKKDYIYTIVDSPSSPISRYGVPRSLICFLITLSGFFLSLVLVILKNFIKR